MQKIVPIHRKEIAHLFCEETATWEVQRGYDRLVTNYLKAGADIDLLGISQTDRLLATGMMDCTDSLDPNLSVEAIVLKITKNGITNTFVQEVLFEPLSAFAQHQSNYRSKTLAAQFTVRFFSDDLRAVDTAVVHLAGQCNLELGSLNVVGKVDVPEGFADSIEVVGYSVAAFRTNMNRRAAA